MNPINIPPLYCPIEPTINPYRELVHERSMRWACALGLVSKGTNTYASLDSARLATLAAYMQPSLPLDDIQLHGDWILWLFVLDDYVDSSAQIDTSYPLVDLHTALCAVLDGRGSAPVNLFAAALRDLCRRITERSNAQWLQRFSGQVKEYLQSNAWESAMRAQGDLPDMATYTKMRLFTGAVYTCFTVVNLTNDIDLEAAFLRHISIRALTDMANLHICWANDIIGIRHELTEDNPNNIVTILQREYDISLQEAINHAVELTNKEMRAFQHLKAMLPSFGPYQDPQVRRYIAGLEQWMRGNIDWSVQTRRYQMA